jgi:hypothetical protein
MGFLALGKSKQHHGITYQLGRVCLPPNILDPLAKKLRLFRYLGAKCKQAAPIFY